jgi:uncharacterized protein (TIGR02466 family)
MYILDYCARVHRQEFDYNNMTESCRYLFLMFYAFINIYMIEELFPIKIYRGHINGVPEIYEKVKPKLQKLWDQPDSILPPWIVDGTVYATFPRYQEMDSNGLIQEWPEMQPIVQEVYRMANEYYALMKFDPAYEPYIDSMWANCYTPGATGLSHNHPEMVISGGFYFNCTPGQGNIIMEHPLTEQILNHPVDPEFSKPLVEKEYIVETGDLILWPGWFNHTIKKNTLDHNRISVGIMFKSRLK